jgi:lipopolysaccharide export system protein LptA
MRSTGLFITMTALALGLMACPAAAQQLSANSKGPVDITADELEVHNNECTSIWRGSAEALQGDARLRADVLTAHMEPKPAKPAAGAGSSSPSGSNCGELQRMEAKGSVYYVTPQQRMRGDLATYDATNTTLVITGDVVIVQGQNVQRGNKLVYNTQTGQGQMEGVSKGRKGDRPRGVFYPKQSDTTSTPAPK